VATGGRRLGALDRRSGREGRLAHLRRCRECRLILDFSGRNYHAQTLRQLVATMQPVSVPRTLQVVLSREEISRLIAAAWNLKHQTALAVAYGGGLRDSEVIALMVGDIDSQRMTSRVKQVKGRKD
jgi:integrase